MGMVVGTVWAKGHHSTSNCNVLPGIFQTGTLWTIDATYPLNGILVNDLLAIIGGVVFHVMMQPHRYKITSYGHDGTAH